MRDVRSLEVSIAGRRRTLIALVVPVGIYLMLAGIRVVRNPPPDFDERIFLDVARHIVDTGLPVRTVASPVPTLFFDHTPLLAYAVASAMALGGPTLELVRLLSLTTGVLTILVVFRIGLDVRSVGSAFVAATLVAANPFFARYGWFVRMEVPMCLFLVVGLYLLLHRRYLLSGLAIAVAVMLKEVAFAFWVVAGVYTTARGGWRDGLRIVVPSAIAFGAWVAYAMSIGSDQFLATMNRWLFSAQGASIRDPRLHVGLAAWTLTVLVRVIGPVLLAAAGVAAAVVIAWRPRIPSIAYVPIAYVAIAIAASYVIRLKEPRFIIAVVPMMAIAIGLVVEWDDVFTALRERIRPRATVASSPGRSPGD
jgi:4-amino-4-deoxy-L-arabinose transferase-like glycosyltransferase